MSQIEALCRNFIDNFVELFHIGGSGSIKADWKTLEDIQKWISDENTKQLILLTTGLGLQNVIFNRPYRGDISTTNDNKKTLWQVYSVCFVTYAKMCQACRIPADEKYDKITIEQITFKTI